MVADENRGLCGELLLSPNANARAKEGKEPGKCQTDGVEGVGTRLFLGGILGQKKGADLKIHDEQNTKRKEKAEKQGQDPSKMQSGKGEVKECRKCGRAKPKEKSDHIDLPNCIFTRYYCTTKS